MTRKEHLEWCRRRALEYLDQGDVPNAVTSMLSNLQKHPETKLSAESPLSMLGMMTIMQNDRAGAKRFIEGFN
jgi:hypothetical protein